MKNVLIAQGVLTATTIGAKMLILSEAMTTIYVFIASIVIYFFFQNRFINRSVQSKVTLFIANTLLCLQLMVFSLNFEGAINIMYIACGISMLGIVVITLLGGQAKEIKSKHLLYGYIFFNLMWIPTLLIYVLNKQI